MKIFLRNIFAIMLCVVLGASVTTMPPAKTIYAQTQQSKKEELEKKLDSANKKLKELGEEKKDTQEYLETLDDKLEYLKEQYTLSKNEADEITQRVAKLESNIDSNTNSMAEINTELADLEKSYSQLSKEYQNLCDAYCKRMRAMYVSGEAESKLMFLLQSNGIENFLTRAQMISAVSKRDAKLAKDFQSKMDTIISTQEQLNKKEDDLAKTQAILKSDTQSLKIQKQNLDDKQKEMSTKRSIIEDQQVEANQLLQNINDQTKKYGEFRDITQAELDEIDNAIALADKKYATTTTKKSTTKKKTTTTTTTTTTKKNDLSSSSSTTKKTTTTTTTTVPSSATSSYINLTYPCPAYKTITCGFGAYSGHMGCDFSTKGNENQNIVASESGTVILSTDITCNRSTCKKSHHGGGYCSYGRYIVIRHNKTTSSGKVVYTLYAHNNTRLVSAGQEVTKGQLIAKSGSTGNSTGPHLHYEVRVGGSSQSYAVNPALYLS